MSKEFPWFRLYTEARTDNKLKILTDAEHRVWFNLLCFAAEQEDRGIVPIDGFVLAVEVAAGDEALLCATLDKLERLRIVGRSDDGRIEFVNFLTRQYDKPSDTPERVAERVRAHRERRRNAGNADVTPTKRDVAPQEGERDREGEGDRENGEAKASAADAAGAEPAAAVSDFPEEDTTTPGHVYALVDAFAKATKRAPSQIQGRDRADAAAAFRPIAVQTTTKDLAACVLYLRSDPFWRDPGRLTARKLAQTIPEWIAAERPTAVAPRASPVRGQSDFGDRVRQNVAKASQLLNGAAPIDDADVIETTGRVRA